MSNLMQATDSTIQRKLLTQVEKRLPYLTAGKVYTLAAILGESFWEHDDEDSHHALGRAFSALVTKKRVPFKAKGWTSNRHNEYKYKPSE